MTYFTLAILGSFSLRVFFFGIFFWGGGGVEGVTSILMAPSGAQGEYG